MKNNRTCVDSTLEELSKLQNDRHLTSSMKDQIQALETELGFLKMYIWWLSKSNGALFSKHEGSESRRKSHIKYTIGKARKGLYQSGVNALEKGEFTEWDDLVSKLQDKIQQCYPKMEEFYGDLVMDDVDKFKLSTSEIQQSLEFNFTLLDHFCRNYSDNVLLILDYMKRKANFSVKLLKLTGKACRYFHSKELRNLIKRWVFSIEHTHIFALNLRVKAQTEEDKASQLEKYLFTILKVGIKEQTEEDKDCVSYYIGIFVFVSYYIKILTASKGKSSPSDVLLMGEIPLDFVDLLLESPAFHVKEDIIDNIRVALIILFSFVVESPETNDNRVGNLISSATDVLFNIESYMNQQIVEDVTKESDSLILLPDLLDEIITVKANVTYFYTLDISTFYFPRTNVPGLIDTLLMDLKEILECSRISSTSFLKHQVSIVQKEFLSLRPLLKHVLQLQNEHQGLEDLWIRIANVSHHARDAANSLFYRSDSICQDIICLSDVIEKIKQIKCDIEKIQQDHQMYDTKVINTELSSCSPLPVQVDTSRIKEFVVRLKDEEENIISRLLRGTSKLHIIAICGMGGLGKTTLAKKVYNHPSVQSHFHKYAWCTVSQTYRKGKILLDILSQIIASNDEVSKMKETDLDEKLYKSLKGQKYLIILDDIWDSMAWDAIKDSFPNDDNGSRVIFTTRIHQLALQANSDSIVHHLRPLRNEESWQLLQMKLFQKYDCPQEFLDVAKQIANDCKGLPISIVLITGLISRDVHNLNWWKQIAQSLDSQIASEGGRNILELSYKHLAEFLKPCFLYFSVFQEDKVIRVQKLIQLWISEGFVQDHEKKLSEDVAREYLMDLVARSLVTITKRSSNGGIKACGIHDLLRDFCLVKADEEFFFRVVRGNVVSHSYWHALCKHYRLCIQTKDWRSFFHSYPSHPGVHSLLFSPDNTFGSFKWDQYFSFMEYKFLQLLDLEDVKVLGDFPKK